MTLVPRIDESACAAHGDCVEIAPGVFALDDVAVVIGDRPIRPDPGGGAWMPLIGHLHPRNRHGRDRLSLTRPGAGRHVRFALDSAGRSVQSAPGCRSHRKDELMSQLAIDDATIEGLRSAVGGEVITPEDAAYDGLRKVWNGMIDAPSGADRAVHVHRRRGRRGQLRPRTRPGRLRARRRALDARLQHLRRRHRDRPAADERRRGRSRGAHGARAGRREVGRPRRAPPRSTAWRSPAAACPTPASAAWRWAAAAAGSSARTERPARACCSAEVVTADGSVVRASADENADLFWGLRGGGGNFGVVTEFEFDLHPVGPIVMGGMLAFPRAQAREIIRAYRDFMEQAPKEVCGGLALITAPPEDFVPEAARGKPAVGIIFCYVGPPEEGEQPLQPLREELPEPVARHGAADAVRGAAADAGRRQPARHPRVLQGRLPRLSCRTRRSTSSSSRRSSCRRRSAS